MAHERGNCKTSCIQDKRTCYHNVACTIARQFSNGRWLIENQYHYVKAIDSEGVVFEEGEYQAHHNPNAAPQYPFSLEKNIGKRNEEDFNAKLVRLKKTKEAQDTAVNTHINVNGSATDADHWSESEKVWHTKDCKTIAR